MDRRPEALLLKFPGTNCDRETARALGTVGFDARVAHLPELSPPRVLESDLVVFSGGFSYGDYVKAGRLARLETRRRLGEVFDEFRDAGGFVLGICNGFQILLEMGLLPEGSLIRNSTRRFMCRWVELERTDSSSPYLGELPDRFELPIANMEGRFVAREGKAEQYRREGRVALTYRSDPNGSQGAIAGLQDESGRVLGLMPHPERFLYRQDHYDPDWNRDARWGWGFYFFASLFQSVCGANPDRYPATVSPGE